MRKYLQFLLPLLIFFSLVKGCSPGTPQDHSPLLNFTVLLGSGGGFTGNYEGIFIDSSGSVFKWTGRTFDSSRKSLSKKLNDDELCSVINLIDTSGIEEIKYSDHGNISSFIIIKTDEGEKRISWKGLEPDNRVPGRVRSFYSAIKKITN